MLRCGSLSQVREEELPSAEARPPRSPRRARRSRRNRGGKDPLSLVGSDISVRDHPLAILERSPERRDDGRAPRQREGGRNYIEERVRSLQRKIYQGDRSLSPCTVASVRKRGLDEIGLLLSATSSLSDHTPRRNRREGKGKLERRAVRKIHGKAASEGGGTPACPACKGRLTYRYLSKDGQFVTVCEIRDGRDPAKEKLQRLLPPLCRRCGTYLLYAESRCKQRMLDNFHEWLEGGQDDGTARESDAGDDDSHDRDRRVARLIVVSSAPANDSQKTKGQEELGVQVAASFGSSQTEATPRLSNRSDKSEGSPFFDETRAPDHPNDKVLRCDDPETPNDGPTEAANEVKDEGRAESEEKGGTASMAVMPAEQTEPAESNYGRREGISPDYFSDDDPFSELGDEEEDDDEKTAFDPQSSVASRSADSGGGSAENDPDEQEGIQFVKIDDIGATPSVGSIRLIRTESEERAILECHSMTKEIATVQIAKDLIRGHELTPSQCERCRMPMMTNDSGEAECVTCPAVERKARRSARQKRKALKAAEGEVGRAAFAAAEADGEGDARRHDNLSALEEGLAGSTSYGESVDDEASLQQHPTSSSIGLNPLDSDRGDYWVRHTASQLQVARNAQRPEASQTSAFPFFSASQSSSSQIDCGPGPTEVEGGRLSQSFSGQYQESLSEVSDALGPQPESVVDPTAAEERRLSGSISDQFHGSLSEVSDAAQGSQSESGPSPTAIKGGHLSRSLSNHYQSSLSEVSQVKGPSDVSYHSYTLSVASNGIPIQQSPAQVNPGLGHSNLGASSKVSLYQGSSDLSSQCQSEPHAAPGVEEQIDTGSDHLPASNDEGLAQTQPRPTTTEYHQLYHQPHHCQSNLSSSEVSDYHAPSEESSTRCPRNLPSDEMIWHTDPTQCNSEPAKSYPVQSCTSEGSVEARSAEARFNNREETRRDPLLLLADAATVRSHRSNSGTQEEKAFLGGAQQDCVDSAQSGERLLGNESKAICAKSSEVSEVSETRVPVPSASSESPSTQLRNDAASMSTENSLRARIARLAESLREVADQLPLEENGASSQNALVPPPKQEIQTSTVRKKPRECLDKSPAEDRDRQDRERFRPILPPVVTEDDVVSQSPHQGTMPEERVHCRANAESIRQSAGGMISSSPLAMRNIAVPFSPITVGASRRFDLFDDREEKGRHSSKERKRRCRPRKKLSSPRYKQQSSRVDPPGRRMESVAVDTRDPTAGASKSRRRHDKPSRDPPPDDATERSREVPISILDSVTPKAKGRRQWVDRTPTNKASPAHIHEHKFTDHAPEKALPRESVQLDASSWDNEDARAPLQTANSFGDSSMSELFKTIDEIEDDFQTIVASMPGSSEQTISTKSTSGEHESLESCNDKHSLVEIRLNNAGSFESNASDDFTDVVQRMRKIKDYIERIDSGDEDGDESRCSGHSQGEMSELLMRLTSAAESLRALEGWED